ncbi:pilus assembly protein [Methylocystis sp. WRRC1]|uniref:TadE/TadG family type IV pilus assembly protein n=1 Tax=Methylocystis sp. WRRC1 TaxID=1732014 RepID=UPI001D149156|nr:TadE/TadG family type IV pilus assembly protein [Methylocystis sp. WRRC1]MCC3247236.1 pilus assembly protein [Methylocystis sp. WRRC1]
MIGHVNSSFRRLAGPSPRNCANLIHDSRGFAAVEFGLIALPFLLLIVAILEYSYGNFAQSRLDAVVQQASRQIMTGYVQNQSVGGKALDANQFRTKIMCPKLPAIMNCADLYVDVQAFDTPDYGSFVNATKSGLKPPQLDNSKNAYCVGGAKKYVVIRAAYPAPLLTTALIFPSSTTYKGRKTRLVQSTATFKNEPFPTSNVGC